MNNMQATKFISKLFFIIMVLTFISISCNDEIQRIRPVNIYDDQGRLKVSKWKNLDNESFGNTRIFDSVGNLIYLYPYEYNKKSGMEQLYYSAGNILRLTSYDKDLQNGPDLIFYPNGMIKVISRYSNDKVVGSYYFFDSTGVLNHYRFCGEPGVFYFEVNYSGTDIGFNGKPITQLVDTLSGNNSISKITEPYRFLVASPPMLQRDLKFVSTTDGIETLEGVTYDYIGDTLLVDTKLLLGIEVKHLQCRFSSIQFGVDTTFILSF